MSEYQGCGVCKHTNVDAKEYPCRECIHNVATIQDYYKPMTNADRIRNMTDEELAERILYEFDTKDVCLFCIPTMRTKGVCNGKCKSGILQWLQAEVKEGESNAES